MKWIAEALPRANFGKDLLNTFGAFMTICRVQRNNAEARIAAMRTNGWKPETISAITKASTASADISPDEATEDTDLEEAARDQIAQLIAARFKGHGLTRLVEAILKAQGYITYRSAEGADGGADILAGSGPLGFGSPRLCVEVKSENAPIDRPTVDKLLGAVSKFGAQEGLFVSWSGFKTNVQKELAASFFRVRLWTQKDLLERYSTITTTSTTISRPNCRSSAFGQWRPKMKNDITRPAEFMRSNRSMASEVNRQTISVEDFFSFVVATIGTV